MSIACLRKQVEGPSKVVDGFLLSQSAVQPASIFCPLWRAWPHLLGLGFVFRVLLGNHYTLFTGHLSSDGFYRTIFTPHTIIFRIFSQEVNSILKNNTTRHVFTVSLYVQWMCKGCAFSRGKMNWLCKDLPHNLSQLEPAATITF